MKLEPKNIIPYLPYFLKANLTRRLFERSNVTLINIQINYNEPFREFHIKTNENITYGFYEIKPILRPLTDLTKEIEHNGERLVPIIEIAYLSINMANERPKVKEIKSFIELECTVMQVHFEDDRLPFFEFSYSDDFGEFENQDSFCICLNEDKVCHNPLVILEKIYEYHFDIKGLIPNGLAIDINTLKQ